MNKLICGLLLLSTVSHAGRVPEELESIGGIGQGYGNAGAAIPTNGSGAVRANPALMSLSRRYEISANYHFPSSSNDFYQVGVVDSVSSQVAVGIQLNGFMDEEVSTRFKNPLTRRIQGGASFLLGQLALGVSGQQLQWSYGPQKKEAKTFGLGVATMTGPLVIGISGENIKNSGAEDFAPRHLRGGVTWSYAELVLGVEVSKRDRVSQELSSRLSDLRFTQTLPEPEVMASIYGAYKLWQSVTASAAYGQTQDGQRKTASGGLVLDQKTFQLFWNASLPYLEDPIHHVMGLNLHVKV